MLNDPIKYQIQFMKLLGAPINDIRRFLYGINLSHHNQRVGRNREGIWHVEQYIARREKQLAEQAKGTT